MGVTPIANRYQLLATLTFPWGFWPMSFYQFLVESPDEGLQFEAENLRDLCFTFGILAVFYNSKEF